MSVATLGYIKNYVGEEKIHAFFQSGKLFSLSTKECKPSCHAECFTSEMYKKNVNAPQLAKGWDTMYTNIKVFHGIDTPCTTAASCLNVLEGSAEHVLLVEKEKANRVKNAEEQTAKCAKGEGNLQLAAQTELRQGGIECDDATKAQSILQSNKFANGEGNLQLAAKAKLRQLGIECEDAKKAQSILMSNRQMGALNARFKGDKWSDGEVIQLRDLCKVGYNITEIAKIMNCDVASRRTVHNKIHELQIQVKSRGEYQLLTKKFAQ
jgi:hypothetical protein